MNQFNNLSAEIIEFIFKKVYFSDLINLRIVDKRFKQICEQIKIKKFCVQEQSRDYFLSPFSFYTNDSIYLYKENKVEISKFLNYKSIFRLDKYLKRLFIRLDEFEDFNISILNEFKLLEQLEIGDIRLNDNYELNLENLKIATFKIYRSNSDFRLTLNTNKLFAFNLLNSSRLDIFVFKYSDKILFYKADVYYNDVYDDAKIFINLEYLKLINVKFYFQINTEIVSKFKNLKILDLYISRDYKSQYDRLLEDIISISNQKENLKRTELQIFLYGVKLINRNQIDELKKLDCVSGVLGFQIKNYDLLKDNCEKYRINYCDLIKLIKIIPSSFTNKFPFITEVLANEHIDNEDQFIKFLSQLPYLSRLGLIKCGLTKSFYDQLTNLIDLNSLEYFKIEK